MRGCAKMQCRSDRWVRSEELHRPRVLLTWRLTAVGYAEPAARRPKQIADVRQEGGVRLGTVDMDVDYTGGCCARDPLHDRLSYPAEGSCVAWIREHAYP